MAGVGSCSADTVNALTAYGCSEDSITTACADGACSGVQDCINMILLAQDSSSADAISGLTTALDVTFLLTSAYLVFMMQLGFAVLCAGSIRSKNCMNILLKNVLDACVGAFGFYLFGFAFAYGHRADSNATGFIGNWNFALSYTTQVSTDPSSGDFGAQGWHAFMFQWSFCAAATTILSGAVAERCAFVAYLAYSFFISCFVYPVVVHWIWDGNGWLSAFNTQQDGYALILKTGAVDFAGSGVVHMVGGFAALMGAWIIGPRVGRFDPSGRVNVMKGHSATLVVMGTFLLWFGWYGFNPGSNLVISSAVNAEIVGRVAVITTLGGASSGLFTLLYKYLVTKKWDVVCVCNGVLAGLVSITAGCSVIQPWAAIICGAVAAVVFVVADDITLRVCKIDDPVSAFALHGAAGMWGVLYVGLMAAPDYILQVYGGYGLGPTAVEAHRYGIFYGGHGQLLLCQFIECLVIIGWVCSLMGAFFLVMRAAGLLRVSVEQELAGLDTSKSQFGKPPVQDEQSSDSLGPHGGGAISPRSVQLVDAVAEVQQQEDQPKQA